MTSRVRQKQCKACPWRKDVVPVRDIPGGYCSTLHAGLRSTIAEPASLNGLCGVGGRTQHVMACHESKPGREQMCTGWVVNQLGPGNNIMLRLQAMRDPAYHNLETVGDQHETFEETLGANEDFEDEDDY